METKKDKLSSDIYYEGKVLKTRKHEYVKKAIIGFLAVTSAAAAVGATKDLKTAASFAGLIGAITAGAIVNNYPEGKDEIIRVETKSKEDKKNERKEKIKRVFSDAKKQMFNR